MPFPRSEQIRNLAVRIVDVAKRHAARRAYGNTCRIETLFHAVNAERAFVSIAVGMNEPGVIRTCCDARLAADAQLFCHQDHASAVMNVTCPRRTSFDARRFVALIAAFRPDLHVERRPRSPDILDDPVPVVSLGDVVLRLACHDAVHAADAFGSVDDHGVAGTHWKSQKEMEYWNTGIVEWSTGLPFHSSNIPIFHRLGISLRMIILGWLYCDKIDIHSRPSHERIDC